MQDRRRKKLVAPFYLKLMRLNSLTNGAALLPEIVKTGRKVSATEVVDLLQDHWRPRVAGAWFSLLHDDREVAAAVLQALVTSLGSLDAPPLVIAAVVLHGEAALTAIETYIQRDSEQDWGACGFAAAAAEYLGATGSRCVPTDDDRANFARMLELALQVRAR